MTDLVAIALIGAVPATIAAMGTVLNVFMIQAHGRILEKQRDAIVTLEKNTNSIKDELVKVTGEAEHAKGKLEGATEERDKS